MTTEHEEKLLGDVGRRIRVVRTEQGLNLNELARLTGISAPALSLIETGKRDPRLTTLARIATALRVPLSTLLEESASEVQLSAEGSARGYDLGDYL